MSNSQEICNIFLDNGVGFWDYNVANSTFKFSDNIRSLLGFEQKYTTLKEFKALVPKSFQYVIEEQKKQGKERDITIPIAVRGGMIWVNIHFVLQYNDKYNHNHQTGIIKQVDVKDDGESKDSGIRLEILHKITTLANLAVNNKSFYDGIHQFATGISNSVEGMYITLSQWLGGSTFELFDFNHTTITDENYHILHHGTQFESKWHQQLCENCQVGIIRELNDFGDKWKQEQKRYKANHMESAIVQPIITNEGEVWGTIACTRKTPTNWTDFDRKVMLQISNTITLALKVYRLSQNLRDSRAITAIGREQNNIYIWRWYCVDNIKEHGFHMLSPDNEEREFTSDELRNLLYTNDYNKLITQLKQIQGKKTKKLSLRLRSKFIDGKKYRWYQVDGRVTSYYGTGNPRVVVGTLSDIDEKVREGERNRRVQSLQTMIFNRIPIGIEYFDKDGKMIFINNHLIEMYKLDKEHPQMLGVNLFNSPIFTDEIKQQIRDNQIADFTVQYDFTKIAKILSTQRKDTVEMSFRISKQYFEGKFHGYLAVVIDTSIEKAKENKIATLESYFDEIGKVAQVGIFWQDNTGGGFVSKQWNKNFGRQSDQEFLQINDENIDFLQIADEDRDIMSDLCKRLINKEVPSIQQDIQVIHPDGRLHWINVHLINYNSFGFEGIIGLSVDITQRKDNETLLIEARDKAESLERIRKNFVHNISHEIRTPLNVIVGFSELLCTEPENIEREKAIEVIKTNSDVLLKLINDVIDLSRIDSGSFNFSYEVEMIPSICNEIYYSMERRVPHGVQFILLPRTDYDDLEAYCDKVRVIQIVTNFINNAFKFTKQGRIMLWYELNAGNLEFHVSDTGIGIDKRDQERIFEPFVKLDKFAVGTGIGLSICRSMAEQMGGKIKMQSTLGKGSHFWLSIPYFNREDIKKLKDINNNIVDYESYMEYQRCVAVVEDNPEKLSFIKYSLEGYRINTAPANGFLFFWLEIKSRLTIIDSDSCYGTTPLIVSSIRQRGEQFKIIVINSLGGEFSNEELLEAGANEVVTLPMDNKDFKDCLRKYLSIHGDENFKTFK